MSKGSLRSLATMPQGGTATISCFSMIGQALMAVGNGAVQLAPDTTLRYHLRPTKMSMSQFIPGTNEPTLRSAKSQTRFIASTEKAIMLSICSSMEPTSCSLYTTVLEASTIISSSSIGHESASLLIGRSRPRPKWELFM